MGPCSARYSSSKKTLYLEVDIPNDSHCLHDVVRAGFREVGDFDWKHSTFETDDHRVLGFAFRSGGEVLEEGGGVERGRGHDQSEGWTFPANPERRGLAG